MSRLRIGVDVGGTFTDAFLADERSGRLDLIKVPSVPMNPAEGVIAAVSSLLSRASHRADRIAFVAHGTTLGLNTLLQRKGTPTGLLVTSGFRDLLELGRGRLPTVHDFNVRKLAPLVSRDMVLEVDERLLATGEVLKPLDLDELREKGQYLVEKGAQAIAICFLHSYRYPVHERIAVRFLQELLPDTYVCASHAVWPQAREYERAMAAIVNAYIGAPIEAYYEQLKLGLNEIGVTAPIYVTRSAGGIMSVEAAEAKPIETLLSGPSAGVTGAAQVASGAGYRKIVCLDMGGTTADVAVVDGTPLSSYDTMVAGFSLSAPSIDINSVGAGGGSIAWLDTSGVLKVGPQSAGADPGPVAYGRGGDRATLTDAFLALGYIDSSRFLGGEMPLDYSRALGTIGGIAKGTGEIAAAVAAQIRDVALSNMYAELVPYLSRHGIDLRDYALFAYGGAGPTQGFFLAEELGIPRVIVPMWPGGMCALGSLLGDFMSEFVSSVSWQENALVFDVLESEFVALEESATAWLKSEGPEFDSAVFVRSADMRYIGQSFEINVLLDGATNVREMSACFHKRHQDVYGHSDEREPFEVVNIRVQAVGVLPAMEKRPASVQLADARPRNRRQVWFSGGWMTADVYERRDLRCGATFVGPAVIEQYDSTTVVPPNWRVSVDAHDNLIGTRMDDL